MMRPKGEVAQFHPTSAICDSVGYTDPRGGVDEGE